MKPSSLIDFSSTNSILDRLNGLKNPFTISKAAEDNLELLVDAINKGAVLSSDGRIEKRLIELPDLDELPDLVEPPERDPPDREPPPERLPPCEPPERPPPM